MSESAADPLYKLLRQIRRPVTLREIMAVCLRHIYMGDPSASETGQVPLPPAKL